MAALPAAQSVDPADEARRGSEAMAAGRYLEAVAIYDRLAKALPENAGIQTNLGMAYSMAGRAREALAPLQRAVKLDPSLHAAWLFLGAAYLEIGEPARAVAPLLRARETDERSIRARQLLAEAYLALERHEEAAAELQTLTRLDGQDATAWYGLGQSHEALAQDALDALRRTAPDSPHEWLLIAEVLASQEEYEEAIELHRAALQQLPQARFAREALAELLDEAGEPQRAAAEREAAARLPEPDCSKVRVECEFRAGRFRDALAALGDRRDAEAQYWRARTHNELAIEAFSQLERLPPSPESHAFRAELFRRQGRHLESVAELQQAAKLAPGDRRIQRELAISLYLSRNYEAAEPLLAELLRHEPGSPDLNFVYGDTLLQAQQVERSLPPLQHAIRSDPGMLDARISLGRAFMLLNRFSEAIPHLQAALGEDEDGSLHYQLARAYQATGQPALAKKMLERSAELKGRKP